MQCTATSKRSGGRCKKPAMRGGTVCLAHGGGAGQVRHAAAVRVAETETLAALASMKIVPVDDPLTELAKLAGEVLAWRDLLRARVARLAAPGYTGAIGEQIRADVALYVAALERTEHVLVAIARCRIDERLARISERQADIVLTALDAGLQAADLDHRTRHVVRTTTARHLSLVKDAAA